MRCHYEVLQFEDRNCSTEDIKKQYKRLALVFHPDRNHGNEEEAAIKFKELSAAYSVLSDSQERKWYDDHRDSILRGGDGTSDEDGSQEINLWKFYNSSCFSGPEDGPTGFYTVYSRVFTELKEKEVNASNDSATKISKQADAYDKYPPFGDSSTPAKDVSFFYSNWENFVSNLSFSWSDKYNLNDAPNRQTRRLMEKENIKLRDVDKKAFVAQVRSLVGFIRKRDKRMIAIEVESTRRRIAEEDAKRATKEVEVERRKALREKKSLVIDEEQQKLDNAQREEERKKAFLLADNDSSGSEDDHDAGRGKSWYTAMEDGADSDQEAALQRKLQELHLDNTTNNGKKSKKSKKKKATSASITGKISAEDSIREPTTTATIVGDGIETLFFATSKHAAATTANPTTSQTESSRQQPEFMKIILDSNAASSTAITASNEDEDEGDSDEESDSEVVDLFSCELCKKHFKTDAQLNQHLSSKVHRKAVQDLAKKQKKAPNNNKIKT